MKLASPSASGGAGAGESPFSLHRHNVIRTGQMFVSILTLFVPIVTQYMILTC